MASEHEVLTNEEINTIYARHTSLPGWVPMMRELEAIIVQRLAVRTREQERAALHCLAKHGHLSLLPAEPKPSRPITLSNDDTWRRKGGEWQLLTGQLWRTRGNTPSCEVAEDFIKVGELLQEEAAK